MPSPSKRPMIPPRSDVPSPSGRTMSRGGGLSGGSSYSSLEAIGRGGGGGTGGGEGRRTKNKKQASRRMEDDSSDDDAIVDTTLAGNGKRTGVTVPPRGKIPFDSPGGLYEDPDAFFDAARTPGQQGEAKERGSGGSDDDDDDFDGIDRRRMQRSKKGGNMGKRRVEEKDGERERRRREREEVEEEARRNAARRPDILNSDDDGDEDGEHLLKMAKVILTIFHGLPRRGFYSLSSLIVHHFLRNMV